MRIVENGVYIISFCNYFYFFSNNTTNNVKNINKFNLFFTRNTHALLRVYACNTCEDRIENGLDIFNGCFAGIFR